MEKRIGKNCLSEYVCRRFFEVIFNVEFPKKHPIWLKGLEFDGYNENLGLAFEYQGRQHYEYIKFFQKTYNDFLIQVERDKRKEYLSKENKVILFIIPYTSHKDTNNYDGMLKFILKECKKRGVKIPLISQEINWKEFIRYWKENDLWSQDNLRDINEWAELKGYICLSKVYINCQTPLKFKCLREGHGIFSDFPESMKGVQITKQDLFHWGINCPMCMYEDIVLSSQYTKETGLRSNTKKYQKWKKIKIRKLDKNVIKMSNAKREMRKDFFNRFKIALEKLEKGKKDMYDSSSNYMSLLHNPDFDKKEKFKWVRLIEGNINILESEVKRLTKEHNSMLRNDLKILL